MTFLLVIDRILSVFCLSLPEISYYLTYNYDPFLTQMPLFQSKTEQNNPSRHLFSVSSYFATHPITLLLEILGGRMHGPSPPQILGGRLPVPPKSPPLGVVAH